MNLTLVSDDAATCAAERMHTCLPEDETVEGDAHGPQVQSLGESEQRHHFTGLNNTCKPYAHTVKREGWSANLVSIHTGKYGVFWHMTCM